LYRGFESLPLRLRSLKRPSADKVRRKKRKRLLTKIIQSNESDFSQPKQKLRLAFY
jgi:hypothetical protein